MVNGGKREERRESERERERVETERNVLPKE
jgi:hypothetical protein